MPEIFSNQYQSFIEKKHEVFNTSSEIIDDIVKKVTGFSIKRREKIVKGESNEVYSITTENKQEIILRISRNNNTERFEAEKWATERCRNLNIPAPKVLFVDKIKDKNDTIVLSVESKIEGMSLESIDNLTELERNNLAFKAGKILSDIHSVQVDNFGPLDKNGKGKFSSIQEVLNNEYIGKEKMLKIARDVKFDEKIMSKALDIIRKGSLNYYVKKPKLVHCDFSPKHILVNNNREITGIIDFELVEGGDPIRDLARWQFFFNEFSKVENLMNGYSNKSIFDQNFSRIFNLWKIYLGVMQMACYFEEKNLFGIDYSKKQLMNDIIYFDLNFKE